MVERAVCRAVRKLGLLSCWREIPVKVYEIGTKAKKAEEKRVKPGKCR
jgi:hypothetical protein